MRSSGSGTTRQKTLTSDAPSVLSFIGHHSAFIIPLALLPALSRWLLPHLPDGPDTASHFFRAVEIDWLVRHGILYSRWLPDFVFGFGYPLFNFYGPLASYLIAALHWIGLPFIPATLAAFATADVIGAFGVYLLGRDTLGSLPGVVAAIAYAYSPYTLGSLQRGTLPEALVFGLLPLMLWAFYRLWHEPRVQWLALSAFLFALLPPTNNPGAALAAAALVEFLGVLWIANVFLHPDHGVSASGLRWGFAALALGLALAAFYWLPLALELQYVQIARAYSPAILNFRYNFLSFDRLFALPHPVDSNMIGGSAPAGLGLPQLGLALIGLAAIRHRTREQKVLLIWAAVVVLDLALLTLPQSVSVWEMIPGLSLIQFPARLLGPASLLLALLGGSAFCGGGAYARRLAPLAAAAVILFGFGWMYAGFNPFIPAQPTVADIHAHEGRTGSVGTTTAAEFLPIWVEQKPPDESLQAQYDQSPVITRLDPSSLPPGATVISETPGLLSQTVELDSPAGFSAVFNLFYFPGWAARVDGQAVPIGPTAPEGLITFPIPSGRHTLDVRFTDTPPRIIGSLISLASVIALIAIGLSTKFPSPIGAPSDGGGREGVRDGLPANQLVAIAIVGLAALALKVAILDRSDNPFHQNRFDGQTVKGVQNPLDVTFGDQMQLLGYDEGAGQVVLYWRALRPLDTDWSVSVTLDYDGHRVAQEDSQHPGGLPTRRWAVDQYARDTHRLTPTPGTPPGPYELRVTVYRQSDGLILQPSSVRIGSVNVPRSTRPVTLNPSRAIHATFGDVELIGVDMPGQVNAGDTLPITLYWRALDKPGGDYSFRLVIFMSPDFEVGKDITPSRPDYNMAAWEPGETVLGFAGVRIPPLGHSASHHHDVQLAGQVGGSRIWVRLGTVEVIEPERTFEEPAIDHPLNSTFGDLAELIGWAYDGRRLSLYWRALRPEDKSYTVFVHVLDANDNIVAQRDTPPAGGRRPTTSWWTGEIITDDYDLVLPPETAAVRVGLYDPATGERLRLADGGEFVTFKP